MTSVAKEVKKVLNEDGFRRVNPIKKKYDYLVYAISIGKVSPLTGKTKFGWSVYEDRSVEQELYLVSNEYGSRCTILFGAPGSLKIHDHIEIVDNDTMRRTNGIAWGELEVIDICKANREDFYRMAREYDYFTTYEEKYGFGSYYAKRKAKKWDKLGVWYSIKGVE